MPGGPKEAYDALGPLLEDIAAKVDGEPCCTHIVADEAEQKGTGRWTVQGALELGVPVTGIGEAVFSRSLSGHRDLRDAARGLPGTSGAGLEGAAAEGFADDIEQALYASKIVAYAQGFNQIQAGATEYDW